MPIITKVALAGASLVGMTPEEGIIGRRIGMDLSEEDVAGLVEDVLRAVAVMHVPATTLREQRGA